VSHRGALPGSPNRVVSSRPQATYLYTRMATLIIQTMKWFIILGELIVCFCFKSVFLFSKVFQKCVSVFKSVVKCFLHQQHVRVILN